MSALQRQREFTTILKNLGHWAIRALLLIGFYFVLAAFLYGQKDLIPPDIQMAGDFHCSVDPTPEGYKATATVTYLNPTKYHGGTPWEVLIADFKGKNRKKLRTAAEKSCNSWLDAIDKVRAEIMPVDVKKEKQ